MKLIKKLPYFPWRLFWRFSGIVFFILHFCNLATLVLASYIFDFSLGDGSVRLWMNIFLLASLPASMLVGLQFAAPLRRVILKALRIASKKQMAQAIGAEMIDETDESLFQSEPGSFYELDEALNRIYKKLKKRRTQLAHEREESQVLMSALSDAVVSIDLNEQMVFSNSQFVTDFMSREQMSGEETVRISEIIKDNDVIEMFQIAREAGEVCRRTRRLNTLMDGVRDFSITVSPLREQRTREIYGVMGVFHDITEIKQAEKIRIEFVENASHELRTPLTSVKGFLATLKEDLEAGRMEQVPMFMSILTRSVDRLTELVSDMMTLSSLEQHSPLNLELLDPQRVTQDVLERLTPQAADKKILLTSAVNVPPFRADQARVEQVLVNLVSNAIKYIHPEGRVDVVWEKDQQYGASGAVVLRVRDNGPGIASEHQPRIFERFYRVDRARSREVGGTGLGLAIVKHIVVSHGGQVGVRSELGKGAEFFCQFPMNN